MASDRLSSKLAIILHADVVSSTALVQQDRELAHQRIQESFRHFFDAFRGEALEPEVMDATDPSFDPETDSDPETGYVDLSEENLSDLDDEDINDWFK